jgi:hypothetical protein
MMPITSSSPNHFSPISSEAIVDLCRDQFLQFGLAQDKTSFSRRFSKEIVLAKRRQGKPSESMKKRTKRKTSSAEEDIDANFKAPFKAPRQSGRNGKSPASIILQGFTLVHSQGFEPWTH